MEKCKYLLSLKKYEFEKLFPKTDDDDNDQKDFTFKNITSYCKKSLSAGCNLEVEYSHSKLNPTNGRLFAKGGIQNMRRSVRMFLTEGIYRDWDMSNAHPNIMLLACQEKGLDCPELQNYCSNRDAFLQEHGVGKKWMLALFNTDRPDYKIKPESEKVKKLAREVCKNKKIMFQELKTKYNYKDGFNPMSSCINAYWCDLENNYLQAVIEGLDRSKLGPLCFDGFMYDVDAKLCNLPGPMTWVEKENKSDVQIPEDFVPKESMEISVSYADKKKEFETIYGASKILQPPCFVITLTEQQYVYKQDQLYVAFGNLTYEEKNNDGTIIEKQFIKRWLKDRDMPVKEEFGVFTEKETCPNHIYNMWKPFECTTWDLENYEYDQAKVDIYLGLLKTLCNNEENTYRFAEKWIAQIFQYPHIKPGVALCMIGQMGIGKDKFLEALVAIMGPRKRLESTSPEREVWGEFNGQLLECMLVHLSEIGKSNTRGSTGVFNSLITADQIFTNSKYGQQVVMKSIHRFIILTNNEEPRTEDARGQRRHVTMYGKSTYKNDVQFWTMYVRDILKNKNALYSIYQYFMNVKDVPEEPFTEIDQYFSKFQRTMSDQNQPHYEGFLQYVLEGYLRTKEEMPRLYKEMDDELSRAESEINEDQSMFDPDKEGAIKKLREESEECKLKVFEYWFFKVVDDSSTDLSHAHFDLEFTIQKEVRTNDVGANEVRIVDNQDNWWSEKLRQSFVLNQSDDSSYVLSMTANSIFDLFQLYLRKEKRLTHAAAQEYSRKNFCSKLTAMESDYGVIKKRVPQGYKYHLRLDQLVKELDVSNYDLEE